MSGGSIRVAALFVVSTVMGLAYEPVAQFIAVTITALARAVGP